MEEIDLSPSILMSDLPLGKQYIIQGDCNIVSQSQVDTQNAIAVPEILELIAQIKPEKNT